MYKYKFYVLELIFKWIPVQGIKYIDFVCFLYFKLEGQSSKCIAEKGKNSFALALKKEKHHNDLT